jgi:hypothetical protein
MPRIIANIASAVLLYIGGHWCDTLGTQQYLLFSCSCVPVAGATASAAECTQPRRSLVRATSTGPTSVLTPAFSLCCRSGLFSQLTRYGRVASQPCWANDELQRSTAGPSALAPNCSGAKRQLRRRNITRCTASA